MRITQEISRKYDLFSFCYYCEREFSNKSKLTKITVDHIIPKSRGGNNTLANMVNCCGACNSLKGSYLPDELAKEIKLSMRGFDTKVSKALKKIPTEFHSVILDNILAVQRRIGHQKEKMMRKNFTATVEPPKTTSDIALLDSDPEKAKMQAYLRKMNEQVLLYPNGFHYL